QFQPVRLKSSASLVRWHPDGRHLSYRIEAQAKSGERGRLVLLDVRTGAEKSIRTNRETLGEEILEYKWSPDGRFIAYTTITGTSGKNVIDTTRGVPYDAWLESSQPRKRLFVLDTESGDASPVTPETYQVSRSSRNFDWSPDSRELVVTINRDEALSEPYY